MPIEKWLMLARGIARESQRSETSNIEAKEERVEASSRDRVSESSQPHMTLSEETRDTITIRLSPSMMLLQSGYQLSATPNLGAFNLCTFV